MPVIEVSLIEGYSSQAKQRLAEALTNASRTVVPAPPEAVTVMFREVPSDAYYRAASQRVPAPALADPVELVHCFLQKLGDRDLEQAGHYLADDCVLQFPGSAPMRSLGELIEWSVDRYRSITKCIQYTEAVGSRGDATHVYCHGTLSGEWPDGSRFDGVRFIDRFELLDGKIVRQDVWNDLSEVRIKGQGASR